MDLNNQEILQIFHDELEERSRRLTTAARSLRDGDLDHSLAEDFVRDAHTIKGSAALMGHDEIRALASRLEELWGQIAAGSKLSPELMVAMEAAAGRLVHLADSEEAQREVGGLLGRLDPSQENAPEVRHVTIVGRPEPGSLGGLLSSVSDSLLGGATRVDTADLYRLINRIVEVSLDSEALADLALVSIDGSDPELIKRSWRDQLEHLSMAIDEIQNQAVALANVSFSEATATFPQFLRYLGRRVDKDIRFRFEGDDVQIDRQIIDLLRDPLRQILVNAADHGIEPPEERVKKGKPSTGTVAVGAELVDDRLEVWVADDGAGVDWDRVAEVATEKGLPFVPSDMVPLLFLPGFSTREAPSEFSGGGDGLASARDAVEQVHGVIRVESRRGRGTKVTLTLPMSLVLQNVVVVASGDQFWGIPEAFVEAAMPLSAAELTTTDTGTTVSFHSAAIPCVSLGEAVGSEDNSGESEILVVNTRAGLVAVAVGELIDRRRVAVKSLGPILEGAGQVTGAALLGGGQVLVVLDPNFLGILARQRPTANKSRSRVLVVDDSAGVRQLLSATLNGAGFDVEVAGSARDAVIALAADGFEAMVVDYSMPRSSGSDLVRAMRASGVTMPIIMVSGVASEEEKKAAWEAGVDAYLDKFDLRQGVLTGTLRRLLGEESAETA